MTHYCRVPFFLLLFLSLFALPGNLVMAAPETPSADLAVVSSYWKYEFDSDSSRPYRVYLAAEIKNISSQYVSDVAVRARVESAGGTELARQTDAPLKTSLAPNESTFYWDTIYDDDVWLAYSVLFDVFGSPSTAAAYPYLPDPAPLYLSSQVSGGRVTYYGETVNTTSVTYKASCQYCDPLYAVGVYYEAGQIADWSFSGSPEGNLAPGAREAWRFSFDRGPDASFKLFQRVEPLPAGQYAIRWGIENFVWQHGTNSWGSPAILISLRVRNLSEVPANPDVWLVGRNAVGQWIGWTSCFVWDDIPPGGFIDCEEDILSTNMHVGEPQDIKSVEALIGSFAVSMQAPPTLTPTPSATPTLTPTATRTIAPTATRTPVPDWWDELYLPLILR